MNSRGLTGFQNAAMDGGIMMHNNTAGRMFHHIARRNRLHRGSCEGTSNITFMYSLFGNCKLNNLFFSDYITEYQKVIRAIIRARSCQR